MADFISFDEGEKYLLTHGDGLPATCYFALSTNAVDVFTTSTTLAGGINEITGTGYARQSQAAPTPVGGAVTFASMAWNTGSATNWSSSVKSCVLVNVPSGVAGNAIMAWNLQSGGVARDLSVANTTETVIPSFTIASVTTTVTPPPPGGGGGAGLSAYDNQVIALNPTFYLTNDTTDKSSGGHSIVNNGGATVQLILPNNDAAWVFNGSTQYLTVNDATVGDMSVPKTGFLTVECWFLLSAVNQPSAFTDSGSEIYTHILGKEDWTGDTVNCPSTGLSSEYILRYYNANSPTWTSLNSVSNGSGALCYYHFNHCGGTGSGHDDRSKDGNNNGSTTFPGTNVAKLGGTWYHAVGLYTNQASTVNGVSYPNGYVQLYLNGHTVNSFDGGPIIDTFSSESFHATITPTFTGVPLTIGGTDVHAASKLMFDGAIGKVAVYPRLLTATQIQANYNLMTGGGGTTLPTVTGVFPAHGAASGGTQVAVTGTNLSGASQVLFGGTAGSIQPVSATQLNATSPAGTAGDLVDITVRTTAGISATGTADQFTYDAAVTPPVGNDAYDTAILADSPVLYLSGGDLTTVQGTNSTHYDLTNHNVTIASGALPNAAHSNAYQFNGTNAYFWIPDPGIAHSGDVSLSVVPHGGTFGALSVEYWVKLDTLVMPHPSPGMEGGTNFLGKCSDISPPVDTGKPATDGCEWEMRYFNADASNTNSGSNPYGDFCGYAFNSTGGLGAGFDDHIYDISNTSTGKTTAEWFYFCIVYTKDPNYNPAWVTKNDGSVTMYAGVFGDVNFTGFQKTSTPMNGGSTTGAVITPSRTTTPLTIGTCGWYSDGTVANHFNPQQTFDPGFFQGKLAKIAIYDYALTSTQTHAHYGKMI